MQKSHKKITDGISLKGQLVVTLETCRDKDGRFLPKHLRKREVHRYNNLVVTAGRTSIANHLTAGSPSPSALRVTFVALGTGVVAPANSDTTLGTEVYRKATASAANTANVATVTGFFTQTETTGTYREAGLFMGGTIAANSGTLLSRVAINITKTAIQTLTIEWTITIS